MIRHVLPRRPSPGGIAGVARSPCRLAAVARTVGDRANPPADRAIAASGAAGAEAAVVDGDIAACRQIAATAAVPRLSSLVRPLRYERSGRPQGHSGRA